jgi:cytosine/uracil/thiamine/allantoin permease
MNVAVYRMERLYSVIGVILFIVAFGLMIWYLVEYDINRGQLIAATVSNSVLHQFKFKLKKN